MSVVVVIARFRRHATKPKTAMRTHERRLVGPRCMATVIFAGALLGGRQLNSAGSPASATILRERRLHRSSPGVAVEAPDGWGFSTQTGYPAVLFLLVHPDGSKLSVSLARTRASQSAAFADQNRAALRASHFRFLAEAEGPRGGRRFDLRPEGTTNQWVRQLYFIRPPATAPSPSDRNEGKTTSSLNEGVVVTLVTTDDLLAVHAHNLETLVESLTFDE